MEGGFIFIGLFGCGSKEVLLGHLSAGKPRKPMTESRLAA